MKINDNLWKLMKIADFYQKHQRYAHCSPNRAPNTPKSGSGGAQVSSESSQDASKLPKNDM